MGLCLKELFVATLLVIKARSAASPRAPAADTRHVVRSALTPECLCPTNRHVLSPVLKLRSLSCSLTSDEKTRICETTPGVKAYSGYVNLPANLTEGRAYDIHTFFWFVEARKNPLTAPLSLWLQGGPGAPSSPAVVGENGPCSVNRDSATTSLSQWSWTNEVNMLYLDQPVQTGFSYDTLINGAIDETDLPYVVIQDKAATSPPPAGNSTFLRGTFSSQNFKTTANTTATAALAAWNFLQVWLQQYVSLAVHPLPVQ
jgi:carboxypeptidase D